MKIGLRALTLVVGCVLSFQGNANEFEMALSEYVNLPEKAFKSELVGYCLTSLTGEADCKVSQNQAEVEDLLSKKKALSVVLQVSSLEWRKGEAWRRTSDSCEASEKDAVWKHNVTLHIPPTINSEGHAIVSTKLGDNFSPWNEDALNSINGRYDRIKWSALAEERQAIVVTVAQVPNQTLCFKGDIYENKDKRYEDALVAYGWNKFFETNDPTWIPIFPMVKAIVNSLNAAETFLQKTLPSKSNYPSSYLATGVSKRGWATWLLPIVDDRIEFIVPSSIDVVNVQKSIQQHIKVFGKLYPEGRPEQAMAGSVSIALVDYTTDSFPGGAVISHLNKDEWKRLDQAIDPYHYRNHPALANVPKYIINSSSDPFYLPESSKLYFHAFKGQKALLYAEVPCLQVDEINCKQEDVGFYGHGFPGDERYEHISSAFQMFHEGITLPILNTSLSPEGTIAVVAKSHEKLVLNKVTLHSKVNPSGRDFRALLMPNQLWTHESIVLTQENLDGVIPITAKQPEFDSGAVAYFMVLEYRKRNLREKGRNVLNFKTSTSVAVVEKP